jgi:hypothetical protein
MKEEEQEEEKEEEEEETEEARNVDGEQLVKKGSSFPFVSVQVFFNSFFPFSPSPGRTTTHPFVFEKHISEEERVFSALVSSCGFLWLCLRENESFHEEETKLWCLPLPLPLLPLPLLLLLRKWGFAASLFSAFVVDGLGFVQLCVEGL